MEAVILIGIQGAGKSTFCKERFFDTHVRINLDMLRTRHREAILLQACITAKQRFVIDNTNVRIEQRTRYIVPAKCAGFHVIGYFFQVSLQDALRRNSQRTGKRVIPVKGISATYKKLQPPHFREGFDCLYSVHIDVTNRFVIQEWTDTPS